MMENKIELSWKEYKRMKLKAYATVKKAVSNGVLIVPGKCEICGIDPKEIETQTWHRSNRHKKLVAHHWNGHNNPIDVWWVCLSCNRMLDCHDGAIKSIESAREKFHLIYRYNYYSSKTNKP